MKLSTVLVVGVISCCFLDRNLKGEVVFGNLGSTGDEFSVSGGSVIGRTGSNLIAQAKGFIVAEPFTDLTSATMWFSAGTGTSAPTVRLFSNDPILGDRPGTSLTTLSGPSEITTFADYTYTTTFSLAANTKYWIVVSDENAVSNDSFFIWWRTDLFPTPSAQNNSGWLNVDAKWSPTNGASWDGESQDLSLSVTAVPEPATSFMSFCGLACGGYLVRRRRKQA